VLNDIERAELGEGYPIRGNHKVACLGKEAWALTLAPIAQLASLTNGAYLIYVLGAEGDPPAFGVYEPYRNAQEI